MKLNTLSPIFPRKRNKRLGRGDASGHGGTSTKGHKGQKARAGGFHKRGFEGGQMPLARRLPKFGFVNYTRKEIGIVNLWQLSTLAKGTEVTLAVCQEKGWVRGTAEGLKVLGVGELKNPLKIVARGCSETAKKKIEAVGGSIEVQGGRGQ